MSGACKTKEIKMRSVKSQKSSPTCGLGSLHSFALAQCSLNIDLNICTNTGLLLSICYLQYLQFFQCEERGGRRFSREGRRGAFPGSSATSTAAEMHLEEFFIYEFQSGLPQEQVTTSGKHHFQAKALPDSILRHLRLLWIPRDHS